MIHRYSPFFLPPQLFDIYCYDCVSFAGGKAVVFGFNMMSTHPQQATNMSAYAAYASTYSDRAHRIGLFLKRDYTQVRYFIVKYKCLFYKLITVGSLQCILTELITDQIQLNCCSCNHSNLVHY